MLKRLIALTGVLAALAGTAAVMPAIAQANPTCDTHSVPAPFIGTSNPITDTFDFQCGGAVGSPGADFRVYDELQRRDSSGNWHLVNCSTAGNNDAGLCGQQYPTGTTNCGSFYCAGTEHTGSDFWYQQYTSNPCTANGWMHVVIITFRSYAGPVYDSNSVSC